MSYKIDPNINVNFQRTSPSIPTDWRSRKSFAYAKTCRERLVKSKEKYDRQFSHELKMHETMQRSAYDAMRFHRHFAITTMWPPLHNRKEIYYVLDKFYTMNDRNQRRLNVILK